VTARSHLDKTTELLVAWSVTMSVSSQVALRHGMSAFADDGVPETILGAAQAPWVLLGLLAFALGTASWVVVLSRLDLSVAYPLGSLNYVLVTASSATILHEAVPPLRWIGTFLILAGILVIALGERRVDHGELGATDATIDAGSNQRTEDRPCSHW